MNSQYFLSEFHAWEGEGLGRWLTECCVCCVRMKTGVRIPAPTCSAVHPPAIIEEPKGSRFRERTCLSSNRMHIHTRYTCERVYTKISIRFHTQVYGPDLRGGPSHQQNIGDIMNIQASDVPRIGLLNYFGSKP